MTVNKVDKKEVDKVLARIEKEREEAEKARQAMMSNENKLVIYSGRKGMVVCDYYNEQLKVWAFNGINEGSTIHLVTFGTSIICYEFRVKKLKKANFKTGWLSNATFMLEAEVELIEDYKVPSKLWIVSERTGRHSTRRIKWFLTLEEAEVEYNKLDAAEISEAGRHQIWSKVVKEKGKELFE